VWLASFLFVKIDLPNILGLHYFQSKGFYIFQFVTHIFTHEEFIHLFFNMFPLFMFGSLLERRWGAKRYLTYYMVTGMGAGLVQMAVIFIQIKSLVANLPPIAVNEVYMNGLQTLLENKNYLDPGMAKFNLLLNTATIGASGAVFGLLLAFAMLFPNAPLTFMFLPVSIKAKYMMIGFGVIEFFFGIADRTGDNVAHFAHLGGLLFGIFMILYWKKKGTNYDNYYF
jgi:membrane associated rhomboid family serine protease